MSDYEDEDFEWNIEEEDIFKPEMGAFDRVGMPGAILGGMIGPDGKNRSYNTRSFRTFSNIY